MTSRFQDRRIVDDAVDVYVCWREECSAEDRTGVSVVQVHPDAASMEFLLGVVRDRAERAYDETLDATASIQAFGRPSHAILAMLRVQAGSGVPTTVTQLHLGGFTRPRP
jgi:hypothetical protein